ncbi:unnamed protein product [Schistosoma turkestanicum]|nr:unnamed protein product [Schistosoma turkestanicum]
MSSLSAISFVDSSECYDLLRTLKPNVAAQLHPNNVRKVKRALLDALKTSIQTETQTESNENIENTDLEKQVLNRSIKPRYPGDSLILWLDCASDVLNTQLNKRVDKMLDSGLVDELDTFLNKVNVSPPIFNETETFDANENVKRTRVEKLKNLFSVELETVSDPMTRRGLLQSIGFKEFSDYLALLPEERDTVEASVLLKRAVNNVKTATRQYARRQVSWVRNRFLRRPVEGSIPVYRIDVTDFLNSESPVTWNRTIVAPSIRLVYNELMKIDYSILENLKNNDYLKSLLEICPENSCPKTEPFLLPKSFIESNNTDSPFICSICSNRIFTQIDSWEAHLKSRAHQKRAIKYKKRLLVENAMKNLPS